MFGVRAGEELDGGIGHGQGLPGIEVATQTKHRARVDDQLLRGGVLALPLPGKRTVSVEHFNQM